MALVRLVRWDRQREMTALQDEVDRIFNRSQDAMSQDGSKLKVEPAGMKPQDINRIEQRIERSHGRAAAKNASQECR